MLVDNLVVFLQRLTYKKNMTTAKRQSGLELLTEISSPVVESLVSVHGIMFMGSIGFNKSCRAYLNLNSVPHSFSK